MLNEIFNGLGLQKVISLTDFQEDVETLATAPKEDIASVCPFNLGSPSAKIWWKGVEKALKASKQYQGLKLIPGEAGPDQGDFDFLVDKLRVWYGHTEEVARRIAGAIKIKLYG